MKNTTLSLLVFSLFLLMCCTNKAVKERKNEPVLAGGDKDSHGCIGSSGYIWSELRQECVRIFEIGSPFTACGTNKDTTLLAFIILSDNKTKAEIYFPKDSKPIVCDFVKTMEGDIAPVILRNSGELVDVIFSKDYCFIRYQNNPIFSQKYTDEKGLWNMLKK
jgi:hypothetical protein